MLSAAGVAAVPSAMLALMPSQSELLCWKCLNSERLHWGTGLRVLQVQAPVQAPGEEGPSAAWQFDTVHTTVQA